jgi:hypothetical protein
MIKEITKLLFILLSLGIALLSACSPVNTSEVPSDFLFIIDVKSAGDFEGCVNVNVRIDAKGMGRYEVYDTGCTIEFDTNHMVIHLPGQVIEKGQFKLSDNELERLWNAIDQNNFFDLTEDYRMAIGLSYAFIAVEADGQKHIVDNIGVEVPEVSAIVEATDAIMPKEVKLGYGEGYLP